MSVSSSQFQPLAGGTAELLSPSRGALQRRPVVPSGVLAMLIFIISEVMFFCGLVSAFLITRASVGPWSWPPPGQPRLPVAATALNTAVLLLSAGVLFAAQRVLRKAQRTHQMPERALLLLGSAILLGACFLIGQGREWVALLREGMTLHSSLHGSFFYIIVGGHGLHALAALSALGVAFVRLQRLRLRADSLAAIAVFWYFVAGIWPFLYYEIYL